jgi:cytochrome c oxidase subunit III
MSERTSEQHKKIHPYKFTMWIALGSIIMAFAGLTSAVIVKKQQAGWVSFTMPTIFLYSTIIMLASSATIFLATKAFKKRQMPSYRILISITTLLGILFCITQVLGFKQLTAMGLNVKSTTSASFIYVIAGLHMAHIVGGIVALIIMFLRAYSTKYKTYSSTGLEVIGTYWHFVDFLWLYLYIFLRYII